MGFRRIVSLLLSAMMLLTPVMASAEPVSYYAGELTTLSIADAYYAGRQIDAQIRVELNDEIAAAAGKQGEAAAALLDMALINVSLYDDYGTARIRFGVELDGVELFGGDMIVAEDGSVQMVTSLTGNMAFALPAGTITEAGLALPAAGAQLTTQDEGFDELPAFERMQIILAEMPMTFVNLMLGWVSGAHRRTGELYMFDYDTYIDATESRDGVASRMLGKITSSDLIDLVWSAVSHFRDKDHQMQQTIADCLAELGVTRVQARKVIDDLFPDEYIDPMLDMVQPSHSIPDDGALCTFNDVHYFFRKLEKSLMNAWGENTIDDESTMVISYDDYGEMVGIDLDFNRPTVCYPYEGDFVYSVKTDDNWQRQCTAHGELQLYNNQRLIGDLSMFDGEDVGGVNANHLIGNLDLVNQNDGSSVGLGVVSALNCVLGDGGASETVDGSLDLMLNLSGVSSVMLEMDVDSICRLNGGEVSAEGTFALTVAGLPTASVHVTVVTTDFDGGSFAGGQAVDLSQPLTQEQEAEIMETVTGKATGLAMQLAFKPALLNNLLTLAEGFMN